MNYVVFLSNLVWLLCSMVGVFSVRYHVNKKEKEKRNNNKND